MDGVGGSESLDGDLLSVRDTLDFLISSVVNAGCDDQAKSDFDSVSDDAIADLVGDLVDAVSSDAATESEISSKVMVVDQKARGVSEVAGSGDKCRWDTFPDSKLIQERFDKNCLQDKMPLKLICSLSGDRLTNPARTASCPHLEVFDLKSLIPILKTDCGVCPLCGIKDDRMETSQVFLRILRNTCANSVTLNRDGTWNPDGDIEALQTASDLRREDGFVTDKAEFQKKSTSGVNLGSERIDRDMRLVASKWNVSTVSRDRNGTCSNFRKRRLKKAGNILIGRALLERNESPLYNDDDEVAQPRRGQKRKHTGEQTLTGEQARTGEHVLTDQCIKNVVERKSKDLDGDYEVGKRQRKKHYDQSESHMLTVHRHEVSNAHHLVMHPWLRTNMMEDMRIRHQRERWVLDYNYQREVRQWEARYQQLRHRLESDIRRQLAPVACASSSNALKDASPYDADVIPAVFCGGNEKSIRPTYMRIECVEALLKEDEAYQKAYGRDDSLKGRYSSMF